VLRGASVEVDAPRCTRLLAVLAMVGLATSSALLFVAGVRRNAAVTLLRRAGVAVEVTVGGCRGLLGGSGSNPVGYSCWGSFELGGRRYREGIPGNTLLAPGSEIAMLSVPGEPSLLEAPGVVAVERPSARVFVFPGVLAGVLVAGCGTSMARRRRRRRAQPAWRSSLRLARPGGLGEAAGGV
jgi:hypothetical protein